jgi:transcriptional regulator with XRE-family HTH domain
MTRPSGKHASLAKTLGDRLRQARIAAGLTQSQLAGSELSRSFISQIESGTALPSLQSLRIIAARLQLRPAWFVGSEASQEQPLPVSAGARLKQARLQCGLSQHSLAHPGYTRGYVSQIELEESDPSLEVLAVFAERLDRSVAWFLEGLLPLEIEPASPPPPKVPRPHRYRRSLNDDEKELLEMYREMEEHRKTQFLQLAKNLSRE